MDLYLTIKLKFAYLHLQILFYEPTKEYNFGVSFLFELFNRSRGHSFYLALIIAQAYDLTGEFHVLNEGLPPI